MKPGAPVVLILMDQLRADAIGPHTPHLERFASRSVRFDNCVTNGPLCRPARLSLMTGLPVWQHGVTTNRRAANPQTSPSHVRRLRDEAGYHTVVVGKTHLHDGTGHLDEHRPILTRWGYVDAVELPDAMQHHLRSAHADFLGPDAFERWRDYSANHRWVGDPPDGPPWGLSTAQHLDSFCARTAAERIAAYGGSRPLYLQVCFPGPHPPFDATSPFRLNATLPPPIPSRSTGPAIPAVQRARRRQGALSPEVLQQVRLAYFAKVALVDEGIGRVLAALDEAGLTDQAWILVTADHGELLGDHGLIGKGLCYEGAVRVPLLVHPPGGVAGWVDTGAADLIDVATTVMAVAGLGGGGLAARVLEGPKGPLAHATRPVLFEALGTVAIRDARYTLAWDRRLSRPTALFDRGTDPQQRHNRVHDDDFREVGRALVEELRHQGALALQ